MICIQSWTRHHNQGGEHIYPSPQVSLSWVVIPRAGSLHISPSSDNHWSAFSHCSLHFVEFYLKWKHVVCLLAWLFWDSSLLCVSTVHCYCRVNITLCGYTTICLSVHLLMDIWSISRSGVVQIKLVWTFLYKCLFGLRFTFFLGKT